MRNPVDSFLDVLALEKQSDYEDADVLSEKSPQLLTKGNLAKHNEAEAARMAAEVEAARMAELEAIRKATPAVGIRLSQTV